MQEDKNNVCDKYNLFKYTTFGGWSDVASQWAMKQDPAGWQQIIDNIPLKRVGHPKDIAAGLAVLLASDASDWITGVTIPCDGGKTAGWL